jgi:hypothetical protein
MERQNFRSAERADGKLETLLIQRKMLIRMEERDRSEAENTNRVLRHWLAWNHASRKLAAQMQCR